jgi:HPt (histidine-containing phosphotransfer) domain-containing protein
VGKKPRPFYTVGRSPSFRILGFGLKRTLLMNIIDMDRAVIIADESPELFEDLFKMVIESLPEKYSNLEKALETKDSDQIEMYAHQFKGALRNLAAQDSVNLLQEIENQGAKETMRRLKPCMLI